MLSKLDLMMMMMMMIMLLFQVRIKSFDSYWTIYLFQKNKNKNCYLMYYILLIFETITCCSVVQFSFN